MLERAGGRVDMRNASGMTPLAYSAGQGNVKALQTLIDRGADVHTRNKDGTTPLHQAASSGNQVRSPPYPLSPRVPMNDINMTYPRIPVSSPCCCCGRLHECHPQGALWNAHYDPILGRKHIQGNPRKTL